MGKLSTPFGEIDIQIDGLSIPYTVEAGERIGSLCPNVMGRFRITVHLVPDGHRHSMACVFKPICPYEREDEPGEQLECQSFYNDDRFKMSIGTECEREYTLSGERYFERYDYDAEYLPNGMSYLVFPETKTSQYVFGIAFIDDVGWDDPVDDDYDRGVQTWYGADPTLAL